MSNKAKYIVVRYSEFGIKDIVIFSDYIQHVDMARKMGGTVVSAGFISINPGANKFPIAWAYGDSHSLGVKSNEEEDSLLANRALGLSVDLDS